MYTDCKIHSEHVIRLLTLDNANSTGICSALILTWLWLNCISSFQQQTNIWDASGIRPPNRQLVAVYHWGLKKKQTGIPLCMPTFTFQFWSTFDFAQFEPGGHTYILVTPRQLSAVKLLPPSLHHNHCANHSSSLILPPILVTLWLIHQRMGSSGIFLTYSHLQLGYNTMVSRWCLMRGLKAS